MANSNRQPDDPTPAEIRRMCERFQAAWTPMQELHRRGLSAKRQVAYTAPEYTVRYGRMGDFDGFDCVGAEED